MRWVDIAGYRGEYKVSECGQVKVMEREISRLGRDGKYHKVLRPEKILTPKTRGQYLYIALYLDGKKESVSIHRIVCETFNGIPPVGSVVNHKDENKHNNMADNLEWCTPSYNQRYSKGKAVQLISPDGEIFLFDSRAQAVEKTGMAICSMWRLLQNPETPIKGWRVASFVA